MFNRSANETPLEEKRIPRKVVSITETIELQPGEVYPLGPSENIITHLDYAQSVVASKLKLFGLSVLSLGTAAGLGYGAYYMGAHSNFDETTRDKHEPQATGNEFAAILLGMAAGFSFVGTIFCCASIKLKPTMFAEPIKKRFVERTQLQVTIDAEEPAGEAQLTSVLPIITVSDNENSFYVSNRSAKSSLLSVSDLEVPLLNMK